MTVRESLNELLTKLPEERLGVLLDFAEFLAGQTEREDWQQFGRNQFARAYGSGEPAYTLADIKPRGEP